MLHDDAVAREGVTDEVAFEHDGRRHRLLLEQWRLVTVMRDRDVDAIGGDGEHQRVVAGGPLGAAHDGAFNPEAVGAELALVANRFVSGLEVHRRVPQPLKHKEHECADDDDAGDPQPSTATERTAGAYGRRRRWRGRRGYCHGLAFVSGGRARVMARARSRTRAVYAPSTTMVMPYPAAT